MWLCAELVDFDTVVLAMNFFRFLHCRGIDSLVVSIGSFLSFAHLSGIVIECRHPLLWLRAHSKSCRVALSLPCV